MRFNGFLIALVFVLLTAPAWTSAQDMIITRGDKRIPARDLGDGMWGVTIDGEDYILTRRSALTKLSKLADDRKALLDACTQEMAVKDGLIDKYAQVVEKGEEHIAKQEDLIAKGEEIQQGYEELYEDLKKALVVPSVALTAGIGIVNLPQEDWKPMGTVGVDISRWSGQVQIGDGYYGFVFGFRLPFKP